MKSLRVFTDGASRGNPGPSGIGIIVYDENDFIVESCKEFIGETTNNQAEYKALIKSIDIIKIIRKNGEYPVDRIEFFSDSELIVNQLNFSYQVKEPELALLNNRFQVKIRKAAIQYSVSHIDRAQNKAADRLANLAIDNYGK